MRSSSCDSLVSLSEDEPVHFRYHQDSWDRATGEFVPQGDIIAERFAMLHIPIRMKSAQSIPRAKAVVNKEWDALAAILCWDFTKVKPKA